MALFHLGVGLGRFRLADARRAALRRLRRTKGAVQHACRIQSERDRLAEVRQDFHVVRHDMQRFRACIGCDHLAAVQDVGSKLHKQVFKLVAFRFLLGTQEMSHVVLPDFARTIAQMC